MITSASRNVKFIPLSSLLKKSSVGVDSTVLRYQHSKGSPAGNLPVSGNENYFSSKSAQQHRTQAILKVISNLGISEADVDLTHTGQTGNRIHGWLYWPLIVTGLFHPMTTGFSVQQLRQFWHRSKKQALLPDLLKNTHLPSYQVEKAAFPSRAEAAASSANALNKTRNALETGQVPQKGFYSIPYQQGNSVFFFHTLDPNKAQSALKAVDSVKKP
jgi:hypothetical protein